MFIGFATESTLVDLSKAEILKRGLELVWHGEFKEDFVCASEIAGTFAIPKGFVSDGASIPRVFWGVESSTDPDILYAAFAHDFLYSIHGKLSDDLTIGKDRCDQVLREQMLAVGAPHWRADAVYQAVHMFGGHAWNRKTPPQKLARTPYANRPEVLSPAA